MPEAYYRTGAAAKALGLSSYQVRRLAEAELIDAEFTGNQWRIPASEIDRLLKEGIPDIPASGDEPEMAAAAGNGDRHRSNGRDRDADPRRAAGQLPGVIDAYAGAAQKQAKLEERQLDWRLMEIEDRFQQRERQDAQDKAREVALRQREDRDNRWVRYAMDQVLEEHRTTFAQEVHDAVLAALAKVRPYEPDSVVERIVDGVLDELVVPTYKWQEEYLQALQAADDALGQALPWRERAEARGQALRDAAHDIDRRMRESGHRLPLREMRDVAVAAARRYAEAYKKQKADTEAARADGAMRREAKERVLRSLFWKLTDKQMAQAGETIEVELAKLPAGTAHAAIEAACERALAPGREALELRDKQQRRRSKREWAKVGLSLSLPYGFPAELRDEALAAMTRGIDQTDTTEDSDIDAAIHEALRPYLERHEAKKRADASAVEKQRQADERRRQAELRVESLLDQCVKNAVAREESDGLELDGALDRVDFIWEIKGAIRRALVDQFATITNLSVMSDEVIRREIEGAARRRIEELVPER
jgi:excisionase family DNA binding protein